MMIFVMAHGTQSGEPQGGRDLGYRFRDARYVAQRSESIQRTLISGQTIEPTQRRWFQSILLRCGRNRVVAIWRSLGSQAWKDRGGGWRGVPSQVAVPAFNAETGALIDLDRQDRQLSAYLH